MPPRSRDRDQRTGGGGSSGAAGSGNGTPSYAAAAARRPNSTHGANAAPARAPSPTRRYEALADVLATPTPAAAAPQSQQPSTLHPQPGTSAGHALGGGMGAAPSGRVQAADYQPPAATQAPMASSSSSFSSPPHSPVYPRQQPDDSAADLSSLGSDEGISDDDDGDDDDGQPDAAASMFSEAATMFDPNLYLHAQEAWSHWQHSHTHHRNVMGAEDDLEQTAVGGDANESGFSRVEQMSERASLLSSSLAQRRRYGVLPTQPGESMLSSRLGGGGGAGGPLLPGMSALSTRHPGMSAVSARHPGMSAMSGRHPEMSAVGTGAGLSAIHEQSRPEHATMRDAMKTADIGGVPGSNLGLLLVAVSQLCYSVMNLFVTLLDERDGPSAPGRGSKPGDTPPITALEIVFVECFIIWLGATGAMLLFRTPHVWLGPPGVRLLLVARGVFGFGSTLFLYMALGALSLSDATAITFLAPLATGAAASVFLSEPFTLREKLAGFGSLAGVLLIARPSAIFGAPTAQGPDMPSSGGGEAPVHGIIDDDGNEAAAARVVGVTLALLAVVAMSGAWVTLRQIGRQASTYHSIAYFALVSWVLSLALMAALQQPFVLPSDATSAFLLFTVGLFSLLAQVFQTLGLQRETAGRAAMMSYMQIIFATAFQVLLLGTPLEPLGVVGSLLVLANGAWVASAKNPEDAVGGH